MGCDIIKKDKVVFAGVMMYNGERTMIRRDFSLKKYTANGRCVGASTWEAC